MDAEKRGRFRRSLRSAIQTSRVRFGERQRPQDHGVDDAEDRRRRADAERERDDDAEREKRRAPQHARGVAKILASMRVMLRQPQLRGTSCGINRRRPVRLLQHPLEIRRQLAGQLPSDQRDRDEPGASYSSMNFCSVNASPIWRLRSADELLDLRSCR